MAIPPDLNDFPLFFVEQKKICKFGLHFSRENDKISLL